MKQIIFATILALASTSAFAGQICASGQLSTDASPTQACVTITDAGMTNMTEALGDFFWPQGVLVTAATPTSPAVYATPTLTQILGRVIEGARRRANFMLRRQAEEVAAKTAATVK